MSEINPAGHTQLPKLLWPTHDPTGKRLFGETALLHLSPKTTFKVKIPDFTG